MQKFGPQEFREIDAVLDRCYGGSPEENRRPHLEIAFHSRMRSTRRGDLAVYLGFLQEDEHEQGALAALLTVGETYFFRTEQHFDALRDEVIPELLRTGRKRIRMLSAACASGEEAYSLAMVASMAHLASAVEIEGIDVNPTALEKARTGLYTEWSLRSTTPAMRDRFFKKSSRQWQIDDSIRDAVHFQTGNLMTLAPEQFKPGNTGERGFDVIFCRNALIYFKHDAIVEAVHRLCSLLNPGGYLFLGPTETLRGISRSFMLCHTHGTFYYRLHYCQDDRQEFSQAEPDQFAALTFPTPHLQPMDTAIDTAWFDEIQRSAERVEAMAPASSKKRSAGKGKLTREKTLLDVLTLVETDDMTGALKAFEQLPAAEQTTLQSHMVRAALLMQTGKREEAVALAREAIREDDLNAEAHYLLSLGLEDTAPEQSRKHAETAAYLAPNFAMAQVRLGMMQAQAQETELAQASFKSAVEALGTDDRRRLALFGGGFSAAGLRAMCESELRGHGETPVSNQSSLDNTVDTLRAAFDRAFTLPERAEQPPSSAYVCVRVAARRFAVRADESMGGRVDVPVTRVPSTNPLLLGIANLHGAVVPVCDLRQIVGEPALSAATEIVNGVIVIRQGKALLALACDEVMGLEWVPDSEIYGETVALRDGAVPLLHAADLIARAIPEMQGPAQS